MLRKIAPYTKLLPAYLSALILLFSLAYIYTGQTNLSKNTRSLLKPESQKGSDINNSFFTEKKGKSALPQELPLTIEEQEEDTDDDKNDEAITLGWNSNGQKYIPQLSTIVYFNNFTDCPQPLSIPLYILFHSWKNFLN
jgi:hypothetical protein